MKLAARVFSISDVSEISVSVSVLLVQLITYLAFLLLKLYKDQDVGYQLKYADIQIYFLFLSRC